MLHQDLCQSVVPQALQKLEYPVCFDAPRQSRHWGIFNFFDLILYKQYSFTVEILNTLLLLLEQNLSLWYLEETKIQRKSIFETPNVDMTDL